MIWICYAAAIDPSAAHSHLPLSHGNHQPTPAGGGGGRRGGRGPGVWARQACRPWEKPTASRPSASQAPPGPVTGRTLDDWWPWLLLCWWQPPARGGAGGPRPRRRIAFPRGRLYVRPRPPGATTHTDAPRRQSSASGCEKELPKRSKAGPCAADRQGPGCSEEGEASAPACVGCCAEQGPKTARVRLSSGAFPSTEGAGSSRARPIACGISCLSKALNV